MSMSEERLRRMLIEQPESQTMPQAQERRDLAKRFQGVMEPYGNSFQEFIRWEVTLHPKNREEVSTEELVAIAEKVKGGFYPDIAPVNEWTMRVTVKTDLWHYSENARQLLDFLDRIRSAEAKYRDFKTLAAIQQAERDRLEQVRIAAEIARHQAEKAEQDDIMIGS